MSGAVSWLLMWMGLPSTHWLESFLNEEQAKDGYSPQQPRPAQLHLGHRPQGPQSSLPK